MADDMMKAVDGYTPVFFFLTDELVFVYSHLRWKNDVVEVLALLFMIVDYTPHITLFFFTEERNGWVSDTPDFLFWKETGDRNRDERTQLDTRRSKAGTDDDDVDDDHGHGI